MSLYIGADNNVQYLGASDAVSGTYFNAATVTYALKNQAGTTLDSGNLDYVAASNGDYRGVIDRAVTVLLSDGTVYNVDITFAEGAVDDFRRLPEAAVYRGVS